MRPYLIIDVTGSLYYHQMADSSEDELSDSSGNLSVVSDEDFEVSSSSEDSVRKDKLEIERIIFPANSELKINQSVKTP